MGKQNLEQVTPQTIKHRNSTNWKMYAKLKYLKFKKYTSEGEEKNLLTGIIEANSNQIKINIWSSDCIENQLKVNQSYEFSRGKLNESGSINFNSYSKIKKSHQIEQQIQAPIIYQISQIQDLNQIQNIIDFEAIILKIEQPKPWTNKQQKSGMRQIILCGDLHQKIYMSLVMWDSFLTDHYQKKIYKFKGFKLKTYKNSRQFNSTVFSEILESDSNIQQNHQINFDNFTDWLNLSDYYKDRTLSQIYQQIQLIDHEDSVFSNCQIKFVKYCGQQYCFYHVCTSCQKKIQNQEKICLKCGQILDSFDIKYILLFKIEDNELGIQATLFNDACQNFIKLCSHNLDMNELQKMDKYQLSSLFRTIIKRSFKVKIISSIVFQQGSKSISHKIYEIINSI